MKTGMVLQAQLFALVGLLLSERAFAFHVPSKVTKLFQHEIVDYASGSKLYMSIPNPLDTLTSGLASIARLPNGVTVVASPDGNIINDDLELLKLYDIENSRECRSVRERITELDLVVKQVVPSAPGSSNTLPAGAAEVPCLVVSMPNGGEESIFSGEEKIVAFLDDTFGSPSTSLSSEDDLKEQALQVWNTVGSYIAGYLRPGRGGAVSPAAAKRPEQPLILYSYEGNQFCRLVREVLTELDIIYELRSAGKESPRRAELAAKTGGSTQCPYIIDPNTGISMAESADIIQYLYDTYASWTPPNELLEWVSGSVMVLFKPVFSKLAPLQAGSANQEESMLYDEELKAAVAAIKAETSAFPVVVYTYDLSPFSSETKSLLNSLKVSFEDISLGKEWVPGLLGPDGAMKRAALLEMTGQSSLPHIFVGGKPIGGLFNGNPGLLPLLQEGKFVKMVEDAKKSNNEE